MPETLPADWYTDPAILEREQSRIFARNWSLFGPAAGLEAAGAWRAERINGWPIMVVRGRDGALRAFHNVCRHRASALMADGAGRCDIIRCPYHGWAYGTDGALQLAPNFGADPTFDRADFGLLPLRLDTWLGLVFVCPQPTVVDLPTWLGAIPGLCSAYRDPATMTYHGSFVVSGAANWKTYCDNTCEGYHLPHVHPRLAAAVVPDKIDIRSYDEGRCIAFHMEYRADGAGIRGRMGLWYYRFPGFQATISEQAFKAERIEPDGVGHLRSTSWQWFHGLDADQRADAFAWARSIVEEDLGICQAVQRNLRAGFYRAGRLSPRQERHTAMFQALVREALNAD
ncbi:MAG: aromatic ring-hydroxylating dioxygenase subunit alpha [Alphaproteobacteria bacterium]|nr:aromatic ring-hydroxylating dioxygenase subunit alpha [Alphaproteobacteria bacterium]